MATLTRQLAEIAHGTTTIPKTPQAIADFLIDGSRVRSTAHAAIIKYKEQPGHRRVQPAEDSKHVTDVLREVHEGVGERLHETGESRRRSHSVLMGDIPENPNGDPRSDRTYDAQQASYAYRGCQCDGRYGQTGSPQEPERSGGAQADACEGEYRDGALRPGARTRADSGPQAASDKTAAITTPQVISQPLGFTTTPKKTAIGVDTSSRKLPHNGFRRRM